MALRWDLKPVFPNAPEDSDRARITRRSVITGALALAAFVYVMTWDLPVWQTLIIGLAIVAAFDAGDMAVPFEDDESEALEDGTAETSRDRLYRPTLTSEEQHYAETGEWPDR